MNKIGAVFVAVMLMLLSACYAPAEIKKSQRGLEENEMTYAMPAEDLPHEGTWLIWPHKYTYGLEYKNELEGIWLQMVQALHMGEKLHIIAYNKKSRRK